jgi:excinuclease UvrABC nuclease subunit
MAHRPIWQPNLPELPERPGVYLFRNAKGEILYIGKALNLRRRVASYFQHRARQPAKLRRMAARARSVVTYETGSELEALLLESRLIKQETPPFNQVSTQYASLPFVKLTCTEPFPRLLLTREFKADGSHYLGPFPRFESALVVLIALQRLFPLRTCETTIVPGVSPPPCVAFQVSKCAAPCVGRHHAATYQRHVEELMELLGRGREAIMQWLRIERQHAADAMLFERAGHLHTLLRALEEATMGRPLALLPVTYRNIAVLLAKPYPRPHEVVLVRNGLFSGRLSLTREGHNVERLRTALTRCYLQADPSLMREGDAVVDELRIVASWLHRVQRQAHWIYLNSRMTPADVLELIMSAIASQGDPGLPSSGDSSPDMVL